MVNTPRIMKKLKRALPVAMAIVLGSTAAPLVVRADSSKVVTLGANLTDSQKNSMYEYFGTSSDKAEVIEVTNADERKYLEGVAPDEQIGTRTYSCSYVEPTTSGGIQVKVSNLTYVTSSMISSTLLTSGVKNCNVVAASPIEVSGTGALTGIMMAYEKATGTTLNDDQKAAATDELVTTGDLAQDKAENVMNDVKKDVIEGKLTDADDIQNAVENAAKDNNVTLTQEQIDKISDLMKNISQYDYDVKALKNTLDNIDGKSGGFFSNLWSSINGIFGGDDSSDGGIINGTDDSALGDDVVTNSTLDSSDNSSNSTDSSDAASDDTSDDNSDDSGFWGKIKKFFKDLFGGSNSKKDDTDKSNDDAITEDNSDNTDEPSGDTQNDSMNNDADSSDDGTTDNSADDSSLNDSTDNQSDNQSNTQNSSESDASGSDASDSSANSSSN